MNVELIIVVALIVLFYGGIAMLIRKSRREGRVKNVDPDASDSTPEKRGRSKTAK